MRPLRAAHGVEQRTRSFGGWADLYFRQNVKGAIVYLGRAIRNQRNPLKARLRCP